MARAKRADRSVAAKTLDQGQVVARPMWRACQAMTIPGSPAYRVDQFRASVRIMLSADEPFRDASLFAVLDGQGVTRGYNPTIKMAGTQDNLRHLESVRTGIIGSAAPLPSIPASSRR